MLASLFSTKEFCKDFEETKVELSISDNDWKKVEDCLAALKPSRLATLKMQVENLLPGDFYAIWRECRHGTHLVGTKFSSKLVESMKKIEREAVLLENDALLCSMYLNPRCLSFLSQNNCVTAKETLVKIWNIIANKSVQESNITESTTNDMQVYKYYTEKSN